MKKIITILCIALAHQAMSAQEQEEVQAKESEFKTLFGDRHISHGGYGALTINYSQIEDKDATGYLLIEPGIELEFNVVRFFRLALGGYYRYTSKIQLNDTPEDVLNGWSAGITLKFGKF